MTKVIWLKMNIKLKVRLVMECDVVVSTMWLKDQKAVFLLILVHKKVVGVYSKVT